MEYKKIRRLLILYGLILLFIIFISLFAVWVTTFNHVDMYINKNCPKYEFVGGFVDITKFIDCRNQISIERYVKEDFNTVFINIEDRDTLNIDKKFIFVGNYFFYIENIDLNKDKYFIYDMDGSYTTTLKVDNTKKTLSFKSKEDVPIFRKIDSLTGNFTLYKTINDVPENERKIFEKIR